MADGDSTVNGFPEDSDMCDVHQVASVVCGGPHLVVHTDMGNEVLAPGEEPQGTPYGPVDLPVWPRHASIAGEATDGSPE